MHIGIQQRKDDHNDENGENNDETIDFAFDELDDDPMELNETDIDTQTTDALDIIKNSGLRKTLQFSKAYSQYAARN